MELIKTIIITNIKKAAVGDPRIQTIIRITKNRVKAQGLKKLKKTRIVNAEEESFDFVGFSFGKALNRKKTKKVAYFWPSQKAERAIKEKVRKITNPARPIKVEQVVRELNPVIRGWVNYFRIGNSSKKFGKISSYVTNKVRKFMRRRRYKSGYGYKKYPDTYLCNKLGLYRNYRLSWTKT